MVEATSAGLKMGLRSCVSNCAYLVVDAMNAIALKLIIANHARCLNDKEASSVFIYCRPSCCLCVIEFSAKRVVLEPSQRAALDAASRKKKKLASVWSYSNVASPWIFTDRPEPLSPE